MPRKPYPSDLTDTQWRYLQRLIPRPARTGRPRADEREVFLEDFPHEITREVSATGTAHPSFDTDDLNSLQKAKIIAVMAEEKGNKARAARRLGISRRSLYRALERFEIS